MNTLSLTTAALLALTAPVFASGSHSDGHGEVEMAVGIPGELGNVTRTIEITMKETDDGGMIFEPSKLNIQTGETIRFVVNNAGELDHEFVLDTVEEIIKHKALMEEFPEMEHDDPNAVSLEQNQSGEVIWTFSNGGSFEFACLIPGHYESGMKGDISVAEIKTAYTNGVVKKVDLKNKKVTIIHEELTNLGMPAMTMVFRVAEASMLKEMNAGGEIEFVADRVKGKLTVIDLK